MNNQENQPVVTQQTLAQNEAVENVLDRFILCAERNATFRVREIVIDL